MNELRKAKKGWRSTLKLRGQESFLKCPKARTTSDRRGLWTVIFKECGHWEHIGWPQSLLSFAFLPVLYICWIQPWDRGQGNKLILLKSSSRITDQCSKEQREDKEANGDYPAHLAEIQKRDSQPRKLKITVFMVNQGCGSFLRPSIIPSLSSN